MIFVIRNTRSGNLVKDAVSGRLIEFDSPEAADKYARECNQLARIDYMNGKRYRHFQAERRATRME